MPSPDEEDAPKNPLTQPAFLGAGVVVALIVVLGLVLAFSGSQQDEARQAPAQTTSGSPTQQAPTGSGDGPCDLPPGDQKVPTTAPKTKWELDGTFAVPRAPQSFGPAIVKDALPSCFAKSPIGALFASANIYAALSSATRRDFNKQMVALRQFFASGASRDRALKEARDAGPKPASPQSNSDPTSGVQIAGFSIVRYESSSAVIDLALSVQQAPSTRYVHIASTLRWENDDWKLVLSESGQPYDSLQQIPDLTGYIPWSGV